MFFRWLVFLTLGLPVQKIVYIIYPLIYVVWRVVIFKYEPIKEKSSHEWVVDTSIGSQTYMDGKLLKNADDHGAFTMYGFIQKEGLELLQENGSLIRRRNENGTSNRDSVSGDVVVAWFFANHLADRPASDEVVKNVANTYIKNLGTLSVNKDNDEYVSVRCANFGINKAPDSDFLDLTPPSAGPQYYTTAAVLASVYNKGLKYKALFWAHWLLMGGWYWAWAPIIYPDQDTWVYTRDITMKSLYIQLQTFGPRWWITKPMKYINDEISTHRNDLFDAMMNRDYGPLPPVMNAFFSQNLNGSSHLGDRMSSYIPDAIRKIKRETKFK